MSSAEQQKTNGLSVHFRTMITNSVTGSDDGCSFPNSSGRRNRVRRLSAKSRPFNGEGDGIPTAETQRRNASLCPSLFHRGKQGHQHARAAGSDGMPKRHRTSVDVDEREIEAKLTNNYKSLHTESLVQFKQIHGIDRPTGLGQNLPHRFDGRQAEPLRGTTARCLGANHCQWLGSKFPRPLRTCNDHRGSSITHSRSISRCHGAALLESRFEAAENLCSGSGPNSLIRVEAARRLTLLCGRQCHSQDLVPKTALFSGLRRAAMRLSGKEILLLARDAVL